MTNVLRPTSGTLYHVTAICNVDSIKETGLRGMPSVYASQDILGALGFMASRSLMHLDQKSVRTVLNAHRAPLTEMDPQTLADAVHKHTEVAVFVIDRAKAEALTGSHWVQGTDHSVEFFGDDSWCIYGDIPVEALTEVLILPEEDIYG